MGFTASSARARRVADQLGWLAAASLVLAVPAWAQARYDFSAQETRLPKSVLPLSNRLHLDLDPERNEFDGRVSIRVRVTAQVAAIVLHAARLEPGGATLSMGATRRALRIEPDAGTSTWRLTPADGAPIAAGLQRIEIAYRGKVGTAGNGLYRADYRSAGKPARMLATQLEAVHARQLLPTFDEPVFRSIFELSVSAPAGLEVVSNMPRVALRRNGAKTLHRFAATPPMPSYLLALAVGRFDIVTGRSGAVPLRIITAAGKGSQAAFALRSTQQVLPYYADYFAQPYALPKLDQLAVPSTRQGAMEDWGLISYIEDGLLVDPQLTSPQSQRKVFELVAHEVAHQWFGNLVSPASWSEIWLNEAFATWMQKKAAERFHPAWQTAFSLRSELERALERDAGAATRPIRSGPVSEAGVFEVFDNITYGKGGAVLSMLEEWLGEATFRRGLRAYMAERRMQPATAGDLWHHIGRAARQPVAAVAASWTDQPGLPRVSLALRCEAGSSVIELTQERFSLADPLPGGPWRVPVRLAHAGRTRTVMLDGPRATLREAGCDEQPWIGNAGGRGWYRVDYDAGLRSRLAAAFATLPAADRIALLSDSFALAKAGRQTLAEHLVWLRALPAVGDASRATLFAQAVQQVDDIDRDLHGLPAQAALRGAARAVFGPELARLGWSPAAGEDAETQRLRAALVRQLGEWGDSGVVAGARERFDAALAQRTGEVAPSMRGAVLRVVISQAAQATSATSATSAAPAEFDRLLAALRATDSEDERWVLLRGIAAVRDPALAQRLLDESLAGTLPPNVAPWVASQLARDAPAMVPMAYAFVAAHFEALAAMTGEGAFGGRHWLIPGVAWASSDPALAQQALADQARLAGPAGASTAAQVGSVFELRQRLRQREGQRLAATLSTSAVKP